MSIVIKGFGISIVGILAIGLLGCGCLFPSTFHSSNPHSALYSDLYKAQDLRESGRYKAALAKYEQISKKHLQFAFDREVIHVGVLMHLKYSIAFCYTELAEVEGDVSLYSKAEAAATECYETAINPSNQADALYLWGYILFKQARYKEAGAKFKALLETFLEVDALFALGNAYLELGDEVAARHVFTQLLEHYPNSLHKAKVQRFLEKQ